MIELVRSIITRVRAMPDYATLLPGGVFHGTAASDPAMPYLVVEHLLSNDENEDTDANVIRRVSMMFSVFSTSSASLGGDEIADDTINDIERDFVRNHSDIIVGDAHLIRITREGEGLTQEPERTSSGEIVWKSTRVIEFSLHENLTET